MDRYNENSLIGLIFTLTVKILSSRYFIVIFDLIMTLFISVHIAKNSANIPDKKLIIYAGLQIVVNFACIFIGKFAHKEKKVIYYTGVAYNAHNDINYYLAGELFDANDIITKTIEGENDEKDSINNIVNFQNVSQYICNKLYDFIKTSFKCEECEISIFQRFFDKKEDYVKMIAYKNNNKESSTPKFEFSLDNDSYYFNRIFSEKSEIIRVLPNKNAVSREFSWLEGSREREQKICQYVGVPIKTKKDKVEILLQIDVSKEKILGKNEDELTEFAENIIRPFSNLLYCSYERDLILTKFYDIIEENMKQEEDK